MVSRVPIDSVNEKDVAEGALPPNASTEGQALGPAKNHRVHTFGSMAEYPEFRSRNVLIIINQALAILERQTVQYRTLHQTWSVVHFWKFGGQIACSS